MDPPTERVYYVSPPSKVLSSALRTILNPPTATFQGNEPKGGGKDESKKKESVKQNISSQGRCRATEGNPGKYYYLIVLTEGKKEKEQKMA